MVIPSLPKVTMSVISLTTTFTITGSKREKSYESVGFTPTGLIIVTVLEPIVG